VTTKILIRKSSFTVIALKVCKCYFLLPLYNLTQRELKWLQNRKVKHRDINAIKHREGLNRIKQTGIGQMIYGTDLDR
jgi:hypothetical protein